MATASKWSTASSSKASTSSKTTSTSTAKSSAVSTKSTPVTVTNPSTGKSIVVTNVNSLTPAQKIQVAAALKSQQLSAAIASKNRLTTESSNPWMYGDDSELWWLDYTPTQKELLAVEKSWKAWQIIQQFWWQSWVFKASQNPTIWQKKTVEPKKTEQLNPKGIVDQNIGNQVTKTLNAAQTKMLIDKYNSFEDPQDAEDWKAQMEAGLAAKWYDAKKAFTPRTVSAIVDKTVLDKAKDNGENPLKWVDPTASAVYNASKAMIAANLTPAQQKEKAQQYIINELQKKWVEVNRDTVKKAIDMLNGDPSIVGKNKDNSTIPDQYKQTTTITAPNGKPYTLTIDSRTGQAEFTAKDGTQQKYNNASEAISKINRENPTWSVNDGWNKPQWQNNFWFDETWFDPKTWAYIDNKFWQTMIDQQNANKDENTKATEEAEMQKRAQLQELIDSSNDISDEQKSIVQSRMGNIYDSFNKINNIMAELKAKSMQLFDQKATRSADARAKQLADKWYLMDDQAAAVSEYSLADYRRDIEIQKSEIEKTLAEKSIELEQEKAKTIDSIQKDSSLNEQQKLAQINYLNQVYGSLIDDVANKKIAINDSYNQNITSILSSPYQQDVQLSSVQKQEEAKNATIQDQKRRAATDDTARTQYITSTLATQAPDAAPFASSVIADLIDANGVQWYLSRNIDSLIGTISNLARIKATAQTKALKQASK